MSDPRYVAVIDIGKTNAKLVLHDMATTTDVVVHRTTNASLPGPPYPHVDVERLWGFICDALSRVAAEHRIDAISMTTHGACAALLSAIGPGANPEDPGLSLPILDYEATPPAALSIAYDRLRPDFEETASPALPNGLNLGRQLFWLEQAFPEDFARTRCIVTYPQYWAFRLTGETACDASSLGCHTDLWQPHAGTFSSLVEMRGWQHLFAPVRSSFAVLGTLRPEIAARVGLGDSPVPVHAGIHDSNASLLPYLLQRPAPFSVISTGTWVISFAVGGKPVALDPARDTLSNVDALGRATPSGRFMGGREFEVLTEGTSRPPTEAELARVLAAGLMVLPSFAPGTGPFPTGAGVWTRDPAALSAGERTAVASLYAALLSLTDLLLIGAEGPIIVEGPFATNTVYRDCLAAVSGRPVILLESATGTSAGAALLALGETRLRDHAIKPPSHQTADQAGAPPLRAELYRAYARQWHEAVAGHVASRP
ncbi:MULTISPECIES: FGGY-family carbohydrate kinase [unclassified Chelatococcus]|uniref:FGGY-family carbohydrate kinase n=1 Tax=unclassified Chelatococcus TaxID=2638111 RepID=UPI00224BB222|nr:FGGY-family carbohydrate kinase [Chelatococcus sp.]MCO5075036.1 FGGY-family carbohydrate kinase [Chelatococcus sp.]CAH1658711.1 Rhamnulokinase [Hyphomicrobiales bacterium]CAH1690016.1 Rhamnulokinase [Hyphomicrobiales bacterium]